MDQAVIVIIFTVFPLKHKIKTFLTTQIFSLSVFEMPAGIWFDATLNHIVSTIIRQSGFLKKIALVFGIMV